MRELQISIIMQDSGRQAGRQAAQDGSSFLERSGTLVISWWWRRRRLIIQTKRREERMEEKSAVICHARRQGMKAEMFQGGWVVDVKGSN